MSNEPKVESFEHLKAIREACLSNAEDLISSAKALIESGALHVCYHLAVLSLEERSKKIAVLSLEGVKEKGPGLMV